MQPASIVEQMGFGLFGLILATLLGISAAILCGVFLVQKKQVPAVLAVGGTALPALAGVIGASAALASGDAGLQGALAGALGCRLAAAWFAGPPTLLLIGLAAVAGARRAGSLTAMRAAGRRLTVPGLVLLGVVATAALPVVMGIAEEDLLYAGLRAVAYAVLGLGVVVATTGNVDTEPGGVEAGAAAGVSYAVVVGLGESSGRALAHSFMLINMNNRQLVDYGVFVRDALATVVDPMTPYHWATIAAACGVAALTVLPALAQQKRGALSALALAWIALAPLAMRAGDPSPEHLHALAEEFDQGLH